MRCACGLEQFAHQHREGSDYPDAHPFRPSIQLRVVRSTTSPEHLSVRVRVGDRSATPFYEALTRAFVLGDFLALRRALTDAELQEIARRHADLPVNEDEETWKVILGALREIAGG